MTARELRKALDNIPESFQDIDINVLNPTSANSFSFNAIRATNDYYTDEKKVTIYTKEAEFGV